MVKFEWPSFECFILIAPFEQHFYSSMKHVLNTERWKLSNKNCKIKNSGGGNVWVKNESLYSLLIKESSYFYLLIRLSKA